MLLDAAPEFLLEELPLLFPDVLLDFLFNELFELLREDFPALLLSEPTLLLPEELSVLLLEDFPVLLLEEVVVELDFLDDLLLFDPHATIPNASIHTMHNNNPFFKIPFILYQPLFLLFQKHVYL